MALVIRCDKCGAETDERIARLARDGYEINLNRLRVSATGGRADLCETCLRDLLANGSPA